MPQGNSPDSYGHLSVFVEHVNKDDLKETVIVLHVWSLWSLLLLLLLVIMMMSKRSSSEFWRKGTHHCGRERNGKCLRCRFQQ